MGTGVVSLTEGSVIDEFLPQFVRHRNKYNRKVQRQKRSKREGNSRKRDNNGSQEKGSGEREKIFRLFPRGN